MRRVVWTGGALAIAAMVVAYVVVLPRLSVPALSELDTSVRGDTTRGAYIATASGCYACHTVKGNDAKPYAGGRAFKTPFGTIHAPNITPDPETGIGGWSLSTFRQALRAGVSPAGEHYYPAFPYTSYVHMTDQDVADLKAYFDTIAPVQQTNRQPDMTWPISDRTFVGAWRWINAPRTPRASLVEPDGTIPRGAYLVEVLGHCGECHTQRDALGGYSGASLGGNTSGPDGGKVPGLRTLSDSWTADDVVFYLSDGMSPDGDFVGGEMAHVVDHSTSKLSDADRKAIAAYVLSLSGSTALDSP